MGQDSRQIRLQGAEHMVAARVQHGPGTPIERKGVRRIQRLVGAAQQQQIALGGGSAALDALLAGQRPEGQGVSRIGETPLLGAGFQRLLDSNTARPDLPYFEEAAEGFTDITPITPRTFAHGGKMVTDEPIVGVGLKSKQARFTLGEPTREFPEGAPEELSITPMAQSRELPAGALPEALNTTPMAATRGRSGGRGIGQLPANLFTPPPAPGLPI